jgi:hypothetical protein
MRGQCGARVIYLAPRQRERAFSAAETSGGPGRIRTCDTRVKSPFRAEDAQPSALRAEALLTNGQPLDPDSAPVAR